MAKVQSSSEFPLNNRTRRRLVSAVQLLLRIGIKPIEEAQSRESKDAC